MGFRTDNDHHRYVIDVVVYALSKQDYRITNGGDALRTYKIVRVHEAGRLCHVYGGTASKFAHVSEEERTIQLVLHVRIVREIRTETFPAVGN